MTKLPTEAPGLGHNNPPAHEAFALQVDALFTLLSDTMAGGEVDNDAKEAAIDALLDDFRKAAKVAEAARKEEKQPHLDAGRAIDEAFNPVIKKAERGVVACREALTPYRNAKQRAKDEAARKAREEAEAKERAAQQALRQSDDLEQRFAAEQALEQASKLKAVANKIDRAPTGLRTYWRAEITDMKEALRHYLRTQPDRFTDLVEQLAAADARGTRAPVPGVTFHEEKKAA